MTSWRPPPHFVFAEIRIKKCFLSHGGLLPDVPNPGGLNREAQAGIFSDRIIWEPPTDFQSFFSRFHHVDA
jgi:hypothetical protein